MDFVDLGISEIWTAPLPGMGIQTPTPVQTESIPVILEGGNTVVQAPTGSGKTLAYLLPLMEMANLESKALEGIVLLPSRELAVQVRQVADGLAGRRMSVAALIGGAAISRQLEALKMKPKLAVGTPGRVLELFEKKKLNGQTLRIMVIDEADKMFSQGFGHHIQQILKKTLKTRQVLFFSASFPQAALDEIDACLDSWKWLDLMGKSKVPAEIRHEFFACAQEQRMLILEQILAVYKPERAMLFIQRPEGTDAIAARLGGKQNHAEGLHGYLSQQDRKQALKRFRDGKTRVLVTTDFLARGLDIQGVDLIINVDVPEDALHYQHRAGRTGRAGRPGIVITLVSETQKFIMAKFSRELKIHILPMAIGDNRAYPLGYRGKHQGDGGQ
jgi:superfamily II DNA/RNA helicase